MQIFGKWITKIILTAFLMLITFLQPGFPIDQATDHSQHHLTAFSRIYLAEAAGLKSGTCLTEGQQIDLNNANLIAFQDCPGFYPGLAKLILNNGPYEKVQDVLQIADLTPEQKQMLKVNLKYFTVAEQRMPLERRMPPRPIMMQP